MIHVYEYNSLPDDYQSLNEGPIECSDFPALLHEDIPRNSRLHHILRDGIPLSSHWKPLRTEYSLTEKPLPDGDFPSIAVPAAVFSERAWDVLRPLIGGVVEALSINHPNG